jgi:hypothetical protein
MPSWTHVKAGIRDVRPVLDRRFPTASALAVSTESESAVQPFRGVPRHAETRMNIARVLALVKTPS